MRADDTRRILMGEEPERPASPPPTPPNAPTTPNARKPMLWIAALICLALLAATSAEQWTLLCEQQAVAQTRLENIRIQLDIDQTRQAVTQAQSPDAIERAARRLGYIHPGETPVIVARPQP